MSKMYAAVSPVGEIRFESIAVREADVRIDKSDACYGGWKVLPVQMRLYKGDVDVLRQSGDDQWDAHSVAWVWRNEDSSYWMDTLSLKEADAVAWSSNRARSEAMGMRVVAVQITCKMTAQEARKNVRAQIASAKQRGDVLGEETWARRAEVIV